MAIAFAPTREIKIFLGDGMGRFELRNSFPTGKWPIAIVIADLDQDGVMDIVTANRGSDATDRTVSVIRGTGMGAFLSQVVYPLTKIPRFIRSADLDGDGDGDLVTVDLGNSASVLLRAASGVFSVTKLYETVFSPAEISLADLNGDGRMDLATRNMETAVLLGKEPGTCSDADEHQ